MATVAWTKQVYDGGAIAYTWVLTGTDVGKTVKLPRWADRSVECDGTFGGGTITIQGTNKDVPLDADYKALRDAFENTLTFTVADVRAVMPATVHIRPKATGAVTSVVVTLLVLGTGRN